jgi:hypothetical protein
LAKSDQRHRNAAQAEQKTEEGAQREKGRLQSTIFFHEETFGFCPCEESFIPYPIPEIRGEVPKNFLGRAIF